jgi:plastocyanin
MGTSTVTIPRKPAMALVALAIPIVAIVALALTRVIARPSTSAAAARAQPAADTIVMENFTFAPRTLTLTKGTSITVRNTDGVTHTFTATDGSFDTGDLPSGASKVVKLTTAGTFAYRCNIHPSMTGTVVVR